MVECLIVFLYCYVGGEDVGYFVGVVVGCC